MESGEGKTDAGRLAFKKVTESGGRRRGRDFQRPAEFNENIGKGGGERGSETQAVEGKIREGGRPKRKVPVTKPLFLTAKRIYDEIWSRKEGFRRTKKQGWRRGLALKKDGGGGKSEEVRRVGGEIKFARETPTTGF